MSSRAIFNLVLKNIFNESVQYLNLDAIYDETSDVFIKLSKTIDQIKTTASYPANLLSDLKFSSEIGYHLSKKINSLFDQICFDDLLNIVNNLIRNSTRCNIGRNTNTFIRIIETINDTYFYPDIFNYLLRKDFILKTDCLDVFHCSVNERYCSKCDSAFKSLKSLKEMDCPINIAHNINKIIVEERVFRNGLSD
jgi:hypothetical protein